MTDPQQDASTGAAGSGTDNTAEGIAGNLGQGLAGLVAGKIGAALISWAFGGGVPSYFDQVYEEIAKIVKQELEQNTIDQINGEINGIQQWVTQVYNVQKANQTWTTEQLVDNLQDKIDELYTNAIGLLQQPDYQSAGFSVFMVAGGLQQALIQEQAQVDPANPSYMETLRGATNANYDYALNTFLDITMARASAITLTYNPEVIDNHTKPAWTWSDAQTGFISQYIEDQDTAFQQMEGHISDVLSQLMESLNYPVNTMVYWLQPILDYPASPLYSCHLSQSGDFYDYSAPQVYVERASHEGWDGLGVFGWMSIGGASQPAADVPVCRLVAWNAPDQVMIVFDAGTYDDLQSKGWKAEGFLGNLWSDPTKVPVGTAVPVYALTATDVARTQLVTSEADYQAAQQSGWATANPSGVVGYLCSQG